MTKTLFWKFFYGKWKQKKSTLSPGYSILLPVPGDLPLFLEIALEVCRRQKLDQCAEILVIPDHLTNTCLASFQKAQNNWSEGHLKLVKLPPLDNFLVKFLNNPGHNHWLQIIRGMDQIKTQYAILHDADLFLLSPTVLEDLFNHCVKDEKVCLGVSPVWDSWFREHGYSHVVATWEQVINVSWFRSFAPWEHHGQTVEINGKEKVFDTSLWPQIRTPSQEIGRINIDHLFVHFNYVISTYRWFQKSRGSFEDQFFRLLLIRLLENAYKTPPIPSIPSIEELAKGAKSSNSCVTYLQPETLKNYPEFRAKLKGLIENPLLDEEKRKSLSKDMEFFSRCTNF